MRFTLDVAIERTLIRAPHAAIRADEDDFEAQLEAFVTEDALLAADARCTDLAALIMLQQYRGIPSEESVQKLAERSAWSLSGATSPQRSSRRGRGVAQLPGSGLGGPGGRPEPARGPGTDEGTR